MHVTVPYKHEPFTNFTLEHEAEAFREALAYVETKLGQEYPLIIGGERVVTEEKVVSINPANKQQ
ncbi:MAG: L-glutamate gamma-semialdehyde dehydrogenase, partial [Anoxybacillus mongoliensis]|nr:L-glutamate gamma-semialdehyde dehydrogenase [Anoxybacillus mongoliensis]